MVWLLLPDASRSGRNLTKDVSELSKYKPLVAFLNEQPSDQVTLPFNRIDELVGGLPRSARDYEAWWSNSRTEDSHTWAHQWLAAGWERTRLDLAKELVTFSRSSSSKPLAQNVTRATSYWWVNHKQTFRSEFEGGYIWSPKKNANGAKNVTYENLTRVVPGDVIISYAGSLVKAIGIATAHYQEALKPESFGEAGAGWADLGWMVSVDWLALDSPISPKAHIDAIRGLLPVRHSPLQTNGNGNQGCYLAAISPELGELIIAMSDHQGSGPAGILDALSDEVKEDSVEAEIVADAGLRPTERIQLVRSRRGQGLFRQRVLAVEPCCRLTGVSEQSFLIASHIKPWCDCTNSERLDGHNGLMLSPHIDHLFDRHLISFEDDGTLLVSDMAARVMSSWGISEGFCPTPFSAQQKLYLAHHRRIFKESQARVHIGK